MLPYFTEQFGNAGSRTHAYGWMADEAVEQAREQVARLINAGAREIIFTSGATESCNLALKGVFEAYSPKGRNHIITCRTEHPAVLDTCKNLEKEGADVTYLEVDENGLVDLEMLQNAITEKTVLIAVMYANNETGVLQPVREIGSIAKSRKVIFFTDATQALSRIPVDVQADNIDLLALSGHKLYGPKGVGALFVRRRDPRVHLKEQINGGGQERGFRSGTLNVPGIVGLGKACALFGENTPAEQNRLKDLRDQLEGAFLKENAIFVNGAKADRLPNVSNITFDDIKAERMVGALNHEFAFSLGSACTSATRGPSHVLKAMGLSDARINGALRLSIGRFTTEREIKEATAAFLKAADQLKENNH
jgi:cysteine desulfurase